MGGSVVILSVVSTLVFASAMLLVLWGMGAVDRRERVRRRHKALVAQEGGGAPLDSAPSASALDPARLGLGPDAQRAIRPELIQAGFFGVSAVTVYAAARLALLVALPVVGSAVVPAFGGTWGVTERIALALAMAAIAYVLPRVYLSRRRRRLEREYWQTFPDFIDMLVVCINSGLSLEAALDRAARELGESDQAFRANLDLMAGEMRAGKSTPDALRALADRLGLREARSFAALLRQTIELGTDVARALTTFSDEMRDKRMSRAEETAAALPPKLTLPLGLFIFPVVLIAILAPAVLKVLSVVGR